MINIVVLLEVDDASALVDYERIAIRIMKAYGGQLISAYKPIQDDGSDSEIDEVHIIQFPDLDSFEAYRADSKLAELSWLRLKAIAMTKIYVSEVAIEYD